MRDDARKATGRSWRLAGGRLSVGIVIAATGFGCSGDSGGPATVRVYPVTGRILLADGKPLDGGHIYFVPKDGALTPDGPIGHDGSFKLATGNSGEGAPAGEFKVRIEPSDPSLLAGGRGKTGKAKIPFPPKYLDEDSSGLTVSLKPEENRLEPFLLK